jgi:zinc/manganese transport system substrate-binding protein
MKQPTRLILGLWSVWFAGFTLVAEPLRVVVSTPDVASLARHLGGEDVRVFSFSQGPEDPHVVEILPSFVRELQQADLFIQVRLGLENAWLKDLMTRAANDRAKPGAPGRRSCRWPISPADGRAPTITWRW